VACPLIIDIARFLFTAPWSVLDWPGHFTFEKAGEQDMRDSPIRLAVVGSDSDVTNWQDVSARLQGGCIAVLSDSMTVALKEHQNEFDAAVIQNPLADGQAAHRAAEANKHVLINSPVAETL
jgi:hypothetical protein